MRASTALWAAAGFFAGVLLRAAEVRIVTLPGGGVDPRAVLDTSGAVHVVYGKQGDAYYMRSADNGKTFSTPLQINSRPGDVIAGGERGPRIALGRGGTVHVAWLGPHAKAVEYTRMEEGKFQPERNVNRAGSQSDGATVAADAGGRVFVFWIDGRLPEDPQSPVGNAIFFARSEDNGATFAADRQMKSEYPGRACACCALQADIDEAGVLWLAFRGAYHALRDMEMAESRDGKEFRWREVHQDGWRLVACPMSGADLLLGEGGATPSIAWMSNGEIFYRIGDGPRLAPAGPRRANRNYPLLLINRSGDRLLAWTEGGALRWELTDAAGKVHPGAEKHLTPGSRFGGFTGRDGNFYLLP